MPGEFEIGLHTYFDFGPPHDFYEIFLVSPSESGGSSVKRITVTPQGMSCTIPPTVEVATANLDKSPSALLGSVNPCAIPEKQLHKELKRCKKCLNFSGANVTMHVECGPQSRLVRSDILDRDWFDPAARTPEHTSWTMALLSTLSEKLGQGVMDKPMFPVGEDKPTPPLDSVTLARLEAADFDALFPIAPDKVSALALAAQNRLPPTAKLVSSSPLSPKESVLPIYPPLAKLTSTQDMVSFSFRVGEDGHPTDFSILSGHKLLQSAVQDAVMKWKYPKEAAGRLVNASIEFKLNCSK